MFSPLLGIVVTAVLSWGYARLISKMSTPCQLKWSMWSMFGFVGILGLEAALRWNQTIAPQYIVADVMLFVIVASPAMIWLNWKNIKNFGYEYINEDFYNLRYRGLVATWRNYISSGGLLDIFWPLLFATFQPLWSVLAGAIRPTRK